MYAIIFKEIKRLFEDSGITNDDTGSLGVINNTNVGANTVIGKYI